MFIARKSNHIESDLSRNWSSWNFGENGFEGSEDDLIEAINESLSDVEDDEEIVFEISSIELSAKMLKKSAFDYWGCINRNFINELYPGYWVLIDNHNARGGLSCAKLNAANIDEAIAESKNADYFGEGYCFDATDPDCKLVHSNDDIHIFEIIETI